MNIKPVTPSLGWGVAIKKADGSEFLSYSAKGYMPAIWPRSDRHSAVIHKRELKQHGFNCRVVNVSFTYPTILKTKPEPGLST